MRISTLSLTFIILFSVSLRADYITSTPVGPGMIHHHEYKESGPWNIHVLEIDLRDTLNTLQTVKADNRLAGYEGTSAMAARKDFEGHRIVGAINGDFYASGGVSIGTQIIKGNLLKRPYPRSIFALAENNKPHIRVVSFNGNISMGDSVFSIGGVNETRQENQLVLYNNYLGSSTGTNQWGTEISILYLESPAVNKTVAAIVTSKDSLMDTNSGNMDMPGIEGAILSGHGLARDFLNRNVFVGDTINITLNLPPTKDPLKELIGGTPRLIRDGAKSVEWEQEGVGSSFTYDRHPRTAVGYSADSSHVYFVTVDGRQAGFSAGMSLFELADYMLGWGMYQGVNLDGGGSTTMVIRGKIKNRPSDGSERSVANALMAVSLAPEGPLAHLLLPWEETYTMVGSQLQFSVRGTDEYYNPVSLTATNLTWSCDSLIGSISEAGLFTAKETVGDGYVWVKSGEILDSVQVHVTDIATLSLLPDPVILKVGETQTMSAEARDNFDHILQVEPEAYTWSVPSDLASISPSGVVSAQQVGTGTIEASFHGVRASVPLSIGFNSTAIIDDFSTNGNFTLSGLRVDLGACSFTTSAEQFVSSPSSGKLNYALTTGGTTVLYLNCSLPISGTPESVSISVFGDNSGHWLRGEFKTPGGDYMLVNFTEAAPGINWDNTWRELTVPLSAATPKYGYPNAVLAFPITWTKIYLAETDENKKDSGVLYVDDFKVNFISTNLEPEIENTPESFKLIRNYPNPFNASTRFLFDIGEPGLLELKLFSVDGREVYTLKQQVSPGKSSFFWEPEELSSGVYIYQASLANTVIGGKCLLLK